MTAFRAAFKAYRMHQVLILPRFARLTFALGLATAVFPVDAEYYFNPRFLSNDLAESVDLSAFTKGREAPPGTYRVDIYLNDEFMASRDITFIADDNNADLIPCLSTDLLVSLGIKKSALLDSKEHSAEKHVPDNSACTPLQDRLADASSEFDAGQQHLSLSVPQIYVGRMARGYVSPDLWEEGINAGLLNYSFNGNSINNRSNHNAGKSNYAYLNLQSGINIGSWRLRDNSTWSYNSGSSNSSDSNKWQHINTSAERDIIPLRSRLTVGDSYTDGDIFDSVNFRGLKINSTEAMLPDSQHGFAPVIHGIARGTAQVSVKQNGYDVYQTTVPPGPFTIDDINSAANGGDLQVTIKEADGSIQTLYVPYSSVPVLQRAGYTRYALAMGEYRSGNNLQSTPKFVQASLMHGLKGNWTPYGGMQIAEDYQAFNLGIGKDLGLFGAFSFDITQANTTLADDTRHSGQSVKSVYSKSFYQTGTNIQVAGYRYSTQGFYNLSDSAYSRMSGYTVKPPTGDTSEQTLFIDYFNLFYSKRGQEQISISQQLGNYGTTFFSASRQSYWNTSRSDQQISFGLNVPFGDITTSLNYSYSNNIWQNDRDHLLAFTLNVPFSHWMRTDSQSAFRNSNASYSMSNDLKGGMTNLSGVYGTLLPDNNLNYSVQVGNTQGGNTSSGTSGYSSLNYRGAYANTNVGYSRSGDSSQIYYGMSGGIIAHADGITFGQPLGDTMVQVKATGADNVKIENQTGIHTDWRGYAILPFATEYRENRVALNANSLADNVELDETVVTVIPTHGAIARATFNAQIGGKVLMTLKYGNKSVPFGAIVTHGENKNGSIVAENGQVYLTGLPQSGKLQVSWGNDKNSNCIVDYKLPVVSPGTLLNQQTAICR
ncbi:TPA: fimbrial biogenesis outer membrane usher protein [Escherichia coli]|nr:fimbrial biogenesis outer membrane usher protein [Escherichia coli]